MSHRVLRLVIALSLLGSVAACGDGDREESNVTAEDVSSMADQMVSEFATKLVIYEYEHLHTDTADEILEHPEVKNEMESKPVDQYDFFTQDVDRHILPLEQMSQLQRQAFDAWADHKIGSDSWAGDELTDLLTKFKDIRDPVLDKFNK